VAPGGEVATILHRDALVKRHAGSVLPSRGAEPTWHCRALYAAVAGCGRLGACSGLAAISAFCIRIATPPVPSDATLAPGNI
jgi:hypothetical protein